MGDPVLSDCAAEECIGYPKDCDGPTLHRIATEVASERSAE